MEAGKGTATVSFAIHSGDGVRFGASIPDYPAPFKHPVPGYQKAIRDALWAIEGGLGGQVEWNASFGDRQGSVFLSVASVHGSQFGLKRKGRAA